MQSLSLENKRDDDVWVCEIGRETSREEREQEEKKVEEEKKVWRLKKKRKETRGLEGERRGQAGQVKP